MASPDAPAMSLSVGRRCAAAATAPGTWRAVALDMDGTTLSSSGQLTARTVNSIRRVQAAGAQVIIATGRPAPALLPFIKELALPRPVPTVCFNGACAMYMQADRPGDVVFTEGLSISAASRVLEVCSQLKLCVSYSEPLGATAAPQSSEHEKLLREFERLEGIGQERIADHAALLAAARLPLKVVALTESPEESAEQARALLGDDVAHVIAAEMHIEFLHPAVSKGRSLQRLCREELSLDMKDIVAFGDNHNDKDMLTLAGKGIAMQNAKDAIKEIADEVCQWSNDEEGVAQTLDHLVDSGAFASQ